MFSEKPYVTSWDNFQIRTGLVFIPGYEQYVRNAQGQLPNVIKKCAGFEWPVEATSPQERLDAFLRRLVPVGSTAGAP